MSFIQMEMSYTVAINDMGLPSTITVYKVTYSTENQEQHNQPVRLSRIPAMYVEACATI